MEKLSVRLANRLIRLGVTRSRILWTVLYHLAPHLAGFCALLEDTQRAENTLFWCWEPDPPDSDPEQEDDTFDQVSEMIERAPVLFGDDDYIVFVRQYGHTSGEKCLYVTSFEHAVETIPHRQMVYACEVRGNRWRDWKRGEGRAELQAALRRAEPTSQAPLTMIGVLVFGRATARLVLRFQGKRPAF